MKSVEPDGAAAKAGAVVGDVVLKVDDYDIRRHGHARVLGLIEMQPSVKLTLERNDKELTIQLTLPPAP